MANKNTMRRRTLPYEHKGDAYGLPKPATVITRRGKKNYSGGTKHYGH